MPINIKKCEYRSHKSTTVYISINPSYSQRILTQIEDDLFCTYANYQYSFLKTQFKHIHPQNKHIELTKIILSGLLT
jgi:hypothetical protein